MNKYSFSILTFVIAFLLITTSIKPSSIYAVPDNQKMKPEELVSKHLQSLGSQESLDPARSRIITGKAKVTLKTGGHGQMEGEARLVSQNEKSLVSMMFRDLEYPHEKMGFDGKKLRVSQIKPGVRTIMGRYLLTNEILFKEGLFGGVLSTSWPLMDLSKRNPKLQYDGLRKVDKRQLHQMKYSAKSGSDVKVNLFFDPETFRHVMTKYQQTLNPGGASNRPGESAGQDETRIFITEEFLEFNPEGGLSLPHLYKLKLEIIGPGSSVFYDWSVVLTGFTFGESIGANEFNVDAGN